MPSWSFRGYHGVERLDAQQLDSRDCQHEEKQSILKREGGGVMQSEESEATHQFDGSAGGCIVGKIGPHLCTVEDRIRQTFNNVVLMKTLSQFTDSLFLLGNFLIPLLVGHEWPRPVA